MTTELPYGPTFTALLEPLRAGFRVLNRYVAAPLTKAGGGPLLNTPATGSILVLRTVGRKSGLVREAPLGYAVVDGRVAMIAGYGRDAHWFRNALANPAVEVVLPGAVLAGVAEEVTDLVERRAAFRAVTAALGAIGRMALGDAVEMSDEQVDRLADAFPVLAVRPTAILPGPHDPGGVVPAANLALWVALAAGGAAALLRRRRRCARCC